MSINTATLQQRRSSRNAWLKSILLVRLLSPPLRNFQTDDVRLLLSLDPPIKRFAQRHTAHNTDAIAARDLGVAIVRQSSGHQVSGNPLVRNDTAQTIMPSNSQESNNNGAPRNSQPGPQHGGGGGYKRPASPDYKRGRDADNGPGHGKRARSPSARDRDRWGDGHGGRKRYASPSWDRDRERDAGPPGAVRRPIMRDAPMAQEDEKPVVLPGVLSWFIGSLPPANKFDGTC